jgi:hypothetical protein
MSDLRTLHDAFTELERRVDAAAAGMAPVVRPRRAVRLVPVAATVVAVAVLFAGAVWLVPGNSGTPVAGPPTAAPSTSRALVPATPEDLTARFKAVLGGTATVEVLQKHTLSGEPQSSANNAPPSAPPPSGSVTASPKTINPDYPTSALISGTLTSAGVTGSFALTILPSGSGAAEWCRSTHSTSFSGDCVVVDLPGGSQLATETVRPAPGATAYLACLRRPDGTTVVLNVSNQEDPQGAVPNTPGGLIYAPQPPLTLEQMKVIVISDRW